MQKEGNFCINERSELIMRIMIVAGGTGGHLFPAIRLAEEIKSRRMGDVIFVASRRNNDSIILKNKNIKFTTLPVTALQSGGILNILNFTARLLAGAVKSGVLLLRFRPSVAIGFGGYISGPIMLMASLFGVKTIIHEQNVYPGKANRMLARFAHKIAVSFSDTAAYLEDFQQKIVVSGNPIRKGLERKGTGGAFFTVMVMGGSQGAHVLNRVVPEAGGLMEKDRRRSLEIIHIAGYKDKDFAIKSYIHNEVNARVFSFTDQIDKLYNECEFVVGRAGATSVAELLYMAKPSILVPYPHAEGHQRLNAKVLENKGIALVLEESGLTAEVMRDAIVRFMDRDVLRNMASKVIHEQSRDACDILIEEINNIVI